MASGPVLAVLDRLRDDADVVAEAVWLARVARTHVLLMHVARPTRGDSTALVELRVVGELNGWAERVRGLGVPALVEDVYFGDGVGEVAYAANRGRACAVVAARRCARFGGLLGWRNRNVRLGRLLRVPLVLVEPGAVEPVAEGPSGLPKQRAQAEAVGRDLLDERAA